MIIPYNEWMPDLPALSEGVTVKNCLPEQVGYSSIDSLSAFSNALTARCQGYIAGRDKTGSSYNYAGDATKLYSLSAGSFTNISKVGGYTTAADEFWEMVQSGENIIFTNWADYPQTVAFGGATCADLTTTLKARHVGQGKDFTIFGNTYDATDGAVPYRVWWSAKGNSSSYVRSVSTQCDSADLVGYGWIQRIISGEDPIIFQENAIQIMTYTGVPGEFWRIIAVEPGRGTPSPQSVIRLGRFVFYLGQDGFYYFDGQSSTDIGKGKIDNYFFADVDQAYLYRVSAAIDPVRSLYMVAYPGAGHSGGNPNKILFYNWKSNKWGNADITCEMLCNALSSGLTLEQLDAYGTLETLPASLDSRLWTGGNRLLGAFGTDHKLSYFTGSPLTATITTQEVQLTEGRKTELREVFSKCDGASTFRVGTRNKQTETVTYSASKSPQTNGKVKCRETARFHRVEESITGGFTQAIGVEIAGIARGHR